MDWAAPGKPIHRIHEISGEDLRMGPLEQLRRVGEVRLFYHMPFMIFIIFINITAFRTIKALTIIAYGSRRRILHIDEVIGVARIICFGQTPITDPHSPFFLPYSYDSGA